jgi:hypothetical protein
MQEELIRLFKISSGMLLLVTAIAKLVSSFGRAHILQNLDPILAMSFQHVFWIVGLVELIVAGFCFFDRRSRLQVSLVAWLATCFVTYRLGLVLVGYQKPCSCMGNLADALHIPPQIADTAMKIILAYLLIGSYATLFWLWRQKRKQSVISPNSNFPIPIS